MKLDKLSKLSFSDLKVLLDWADIEITISGGTTKYRFQDFRTEVLYVLHEKANELLTYTLEIK